MTQTFDFRGAFVAFSSSDQRRRWRGIVVLAREGLIPPKSTPFFYLQ